MSLLAATDDRQLAARPAAGAECAPWQRASFRLTVLCLGLCLFGVVMVPSAANSRQFGAALVKRLTLTGLGLAVFLVGASVTYQAWRRHQLALLAITLVALAACLVPGLGVAKNNARRWIDLGLPIGVQPSEFAKVALCIWVAAYCERNLSVMRRPVHGFLIPLGVVALACGLILAEPDFGTAIITALVCCAVLWVMGSRTVFFLAATAAATPFLQQLVFGVPYRMQRVLSFLDPWADPRGAGYQLIQSKIAIATGGVWGMGLGMGRQGEGFLPAAQNDFIFSIVAEELGLIGAAVVILAFVLLMWQGLRVAVRARDPFGFALGLGLTCLLGLQAALHIAVVTGTVPTKGLSLPFISAGGSSLLASMFAAGILVNIARCEEKPDDHTLRDWHDEVPEYEGVATAFARRAGEAAWSILHAAGAHHD